MLVIDDEPCVRRVTGHALRRFGFEVTGASSGQEGLAEVEAAPHRFRLVVVDRTMPKMDGDTVIRHLHTIAPDLPILLMSGCSEQETLRRIGQHHPHAFLSKPFTIQSLMAKVRLCLESPSGDTSEAQE
ncbi:MAG: response regulator [Candidatus Synoicihabitans palmerolidicus]|nr:response regulator [Candidatus Synoicihabitans palmerolidicus]